MSVGAQWEYTVESLGGALRGVRPEELADLLNQAAEESWEPVDMMLRSSNSNQIMIVLRRPTQTRARRRKRRWP
jgi:3'-phosphoadenosine 5'-phosphosulfate sulfotransferase